jgi:hypothetical protein
MKRTLTAITAICSVASLAVVHDAQAGGPGRQMRADLPCPYGGAGGPNSDLWAPPTVQGASPYNPGTGSLTPFTASLVSGSEINSDQVSLSIVSAIQYVYYTAPIPPAGECITGDPFTLNSNGPLTQVLAYTMASNAGISQAGDIEVEFNYNTFFDPALATTAGTASFTMGGVNYSSTGGILPTGTDNDFLFSSSGALKGEIVTDTAGNASLVAGVPQGWTITSTSGGGGGGGGGTVSAPEIDPASAVAGFTLLAGLLAVLRGGRRTLRVAR